ncbi:Armadillo-like helical domain-containing protein 4 [Labeo rohita]|uniref:Armadillo-like helical domain-containing protein 4 n=1 Tax=Labeo rohita TaxID=84645 RepID=A0ABQ8LN41_LABRO|nr:Armadillo-like helical domain-containing protein 4 [Labeo rohita]
MTQNNSVVSKNAPALVAGRKWRQASAVEEAISAIKHVDIVEHVQQGRGGLGLTMRRPEWNKATAPEWRKMVVEETHRQEEAARWARAVSLGEQGQWTWWDRVEKRRINWKDLWNMEEKQLSFIIRATYDILPVPTNLHQWWGEDPGFALCFRPASLKHILTGCKVSLTQGRYTWHHNKVLESLASTLEEKRIATNSSPPAIDSLQAIFVQEGAKVPRSRPTSLEHDQLACDWKMQVDIVQHFVFPPEIIPTTLRPDVVLWSPSVKKVFITKLTVPWEDSVEEVYERKLQRYTELAAEIQLHGWNAEIRLVEVGCRGFVASSTVNLLRWESEARAYVKLLKLYQRQR